MSENKTTTSSLAAVFNAKNNGEATSNNRSEGTESNPSNSVTEAKAEVTETKGNEVEATNTENQVDETTETQENEEPVWFKDDELGIIYKDEKEAKRGLTEKEKYIQKILAERKQIVEEKQRLQQEKEELVNTLQNQNLDEDTIRVRKINEKLPEEFRDRTEEEFLDPDELRKFLTTKAKAEAAVDIELEKSKLDKENSAKEAKAKREEAVNHVSETLKKTFDNVKNSEDKAALQEILDKEYNGLTPSMMMVMAYEIHPELSALIKDGLEARYRNGRQKEVAKTVEATRTQVTPTAEPPNRKTPPMKEAKDIIGYALANSSRKRRSF